MNKLKVKIKGELSKKKINEDKKIQMKEIEEANALNTEVIELVIANKEL